MYPTIRILVVDDEMDFCQLLVSILPKEKYTINCVHTIRAAGERLLCSAPDFVLLDNNLPDGKGIDFLQDCKALFGKSKVIMISADPSSGLAKQALKAGANDFLEKPFALATIRNLFDGLPAAA